MVKRAKAKPDKGLTAAAARNYNPDIMNVSPRYRPHPDIVPAGGCVCIIGMAGAGKTTVGRELAALLGWPQIDTDNVIEATYGARLQAIADSMSKEDFLDLEGAVLSRLNVRRSVVSTGGSAVYRPYAISHLKSLGPMIHLAVPLKVILERIARKPERGLAINPGQTVEDLFYEREALYEAAADFTVPGGAGPAAGYAEDMARLLEGRPL